MLCRSDTHCGEVFEDPRLLWVHEIARTTHKASCVAWSVAHTDMCTNHRHRDMGVWCV